MNRLYTGLMLIALSVFSGTLYAQSREAWLSGGVSNFRFLYPHSNRDVGSPEAAGEPSDVQVDNGWRVGVRLGFNTAGPFGHEFQYAYSRPRLTDHTGTILGEAGPPKLEMHQGGYNFLYYFRSSEVPVRPLVSAGIHVNDFVLRGSDLSAEHTGKFGFNYGVGLKVRITPLLGLRIDLREYETGKPHWGGLLVNQSGLLRQTEASAGLGIYF